MLRTLSGFVCGGLTKEYQIQIEFTIYNYGEKKLQIWEGWDNDNRERLMVRVLLVLRNGQWGRRDENGCLENWGDWIQLSS